MKNAIIKDGSNTLIADKPQRSSSNSVTEFSGDLDMRIFLFLTVFGVYIFSAFPALAPYRDSGEMASVVKTLGIAHPPGYPLYTVVARALTDIIPFSNFAYKVTVVSSLFMALSVLLIYEISKKIFGNNGELRFFFSTLSAGFSYLYWYLAIVQEMYTMSVFFVLLSIYFLFSERYCVSMFLLGLSAGVRMDSVLVYPAFLLIFVRKKLRISDIAKLHLFLILGSSIFLYLLIRSKSAPLINWNDPSTFERLLSSLMRKTHGGTLDLISTGYAKAENFIPQLKFYFLHLVKDFFYVGLPLAVWGAFKILKKDLFWFLAAGFVVSGIFFILLANMPPNPHALAILEAHFLLPDIFFVFFFISGICSLYDCCKIAGRVAPVALCAGIFISTFPDLNKRDNFFLTDYTRNLTTTLPKNSTVVLKEDVQLFSMWHQKYVTKKRPDIRVVPAGLSGSLWFQKSNRDMGVVFFPLSTAEGWQSFIERNPDVYFTNDVDFPLRNVKTYPCGLSNALTKKNAEPLDILNEFYIYRGDYRYRSHREFFTPDLIEDYSKSWHQAGFYYMMRNEFSAANNCFLAAIYMKNDFPQPAYHLGWCNYIQNKFKEASKFYELASTIYDKLIKLAKEYKAMPEVAESIRNEAANARLHKGVVSEKLGKDDEALADYVAAAEMNPRFSLAYYNKAVIYWKKGDFKKARENLELTLRYDPANETARGYLERLKGR